MTKFCVWEGRKAFCHVVPTGGEGCAGLKGPEPIGAPQKKATRHGEWRAGVFGGNGGEGRVAFRGKGQPAGVFQFEGPETNKSSRLAKMSREGVKPGQITKFRT